MYIYPQHNYLHIGKKSPGSTPLRKSFGKKTVFLSEIIFLKMGGGCIVNKCMYDTGRPPKMGSDQLNLILCIYTFYISLCIQSADPFLRHTFYEKKVYALKKQKKYILS